MIYTVTFNPSLDYIVDVDDFRLDYINRTKGEKILAGGKGINVSIVLKNLGEESTALGFTAGFTGEEIKRLLNVRGVKTDFIEVEEGQSRINVKVRSNKETAINGQGPKIEDQDIKALYQKLDQLQDGDTLVLAGAIPSVMPETMYMDILEHLKEKKLRVVVDATRDLLVNVLPYHPFMVKPNHHELGEIFGVHIHTYEEAIPYAKMLQEKGARNVIVSMGSLGAMMVTEDGRVFHAGASKGKPKNTVGAGDSFVAGFIYGCDVFQDYEKAFYIGNCSGGASAHSEELATRQRVIDILHEFGRHDLD